MTPLIKHFLAFFNICHIPLVNVAQVLSMESRCRIDLRSCVGARVGAYALKWVFLCAIKKKVFLLGVFNVLDADPREVNLVG